VSCGRRDAFVVAGPDAGLTRIIESLPTGPTGKLLKKELTP
jgi:hypothetical protein